jgi:glycosyltransferase involved in cell wall biosynthesis
MSNSAVRTSETAEDVRKRPVANRTTRSLRILFLIDSLDIGGAQRLVEMQAQAMVGGPHSIRVVNLAGPSAISETLQAGGVDVVNIGLGPLRNFRGLMEVARAIHPWGPVIIHAHLLHATLIGAVLARLCRARLIITLHNVFPDEGGIISRCKVAIENLILRYVADRVIGCGPLVARARGDRLGIKDTIVISNCVRPLVRLRLEERLAIRVELGFRTDDFIIVAIGRLSRQKGFDVLVEAFLKAADYIQSARLLIVGEGEDRATLVNLIEWHRNGDRIMLSGPRVDVDRLLGAADLFVLSSRWEGLPLVVLEAMAAGLPIVATNVGDVAWATGRNGAVLIPPDDVSALTASIRSIADDPERRSALGSAARKAAARFTDLSTHMDELLRVYRDVSSLEH